MKKSISIAFIVMFCLNLFGASFAFAEVPAQNNQAIEYAFDNTSMIQVQTNDQLDQLDGEWWFVAHFVVRHVVIRLATGYVAGKLTSGSTLY